MNGCIIVLYLGIHNITPREPKLSCTTVTKVSGEPERKSVKGRNIPVSPIAVYKWPDTGHPVTQENRAEKDVIVQPSYCKTLELLELRGG